ncbi:MAG: lipid IV(A) 3-deoxy-D-manno-octulosonic acid transferase [Burkholderiales bacterium]
MFKSRAVYTLLVHAALVWAVPRLVWRARKQPDYLKNVSERFGYYRGVIEKPVIWLHAVSVGETRAAAPLIARLKQSYPGHQILVTNMTPTGRETSEKLFNDQVMRCYLPYDFPSAVSRFLKHYRPVLGLLIETEIWFNLIHACSKNNIPLMLVNARLSEKSAARYQRIGKLTAKALGELAIVAAQSEADAERLKSLGANHVRVSGNLKFDLTPPDSAPFAAELLRGQFGRGRRVFLAASTRDGEEALILDVLPRINVANLLTVIVPRHPQRFDEVGALLEKRGIRYQRRSTNVVISPITQVLLGDSMGELFAYYGACDVAFIGGSLLPYGGQNLIEACAMGVPVLIGPHHYNFVDATELAKSAGAAIVVRDAAELAAEATRLLKDSVARREIGKRALDYSRAHQGATARVMAMIIDAMEAREQAVTPHPSSPLTPH